MSLGHIIQQHVDLLPPYQQAEVLDFVLFLEQKKQSHFNPLNDDVRRKKLAASLQQLAQKSATKVVFVIVKLIGRVAREKIQEQCTKQALA